MFKTRITELLLGIQYPIIQGAMLRVSRAELVAAVSLETETTELARRLASGPTKAIGLAKKAINKSLVTDLETSLDYAIQAQTICYYTEDHAEATRAFLEKREPRFKGR